MKPSGVQDYTLVETKITRALPEKYGKDIHFYNTCNTDAQTDTHTEETNIKD